MILLDKFLGTSRDSRLLRQKEFRSQSSLRMTLQLNPLVESVNIKFDADTRVFLYVIKCYNIVCVCVKSPLKQRLMNLETSVPKFVPESLSVPFQMFIKSARAERRVTQSGLFQGRIVSRLLEAVCKRHTDTFASM